MVRELGINISVGCYINGEKVYQLELKEVQTNPVGCWTAVMRR